MILDYYQEELAALRELAAEFSRDFPALAPMLGSRGDDPDVERLLEGVAFLSGLVRERLEEGFPDLVQSLLRLLFPEALEPVPSRTVMLFTPVQGFTETIHVPRGTLLGSVPVDGAQALYSTTAPLTVLPASVTRAGVEEGSSGGTLLRITLSGSAPLSMWLPDRLTLYFAGEYPEASERRRLVLEGKGRVLVGARGAERPLPRGSVNPGGLLGPEEGPAGRRAGPGMNSLGLPGRPLRQPAAAPPLTARGQGAGAPAPPRRQGFRLVQDYFAMPQRFLYAEITGLRDAASPGSKEISLALPLPGLKDSSPGFRAEHFLVNTVPAENVFPHPAIPILIDHRHIEYLVRPQDFEAGRISIFRVEGASAVSKAGKIRQYLPFERVSEQSGDTGIYTIHRKGSPISGLPEHFLRVIYKPGEKLNPETLSLNLLCHNQGITGLLRTGEIRLPTDSSPAMAGFTNITPPTRHCPPVSTNHELWRMLSHLHVNLLDGLDSKSFRETLSLYASPNDPDTGRLLANQKRIEAFGDFLAEGEDQFVAGRPIRGTLLEMTADSRGFASEGDLRLCGDVLERFFSFFHYLNTYTRLVVRERSSREVYSWPPRLGTRRLV
ncbi:MAG: type VI secretion system baseplate subunit TssF [Deltaproteobacteria bacterium]|jgi:type VI secretion system protein ImpG|nr:type VI secretion system baseplate subunit TssF [Deltaproteobacteria bacterium]